MIHIDDGVGFNQNLFSYLQFPTFWYGRIFRWEEESVMFSGTSGPSRHVWSLKLRNSPVILSFRNIDFGLLVFCKTNNICCGSSIFFVTWRTLSTTQDKHLMRDKYSATFFYFESCTSSHRCWQLCSWFWKPEQNQREGHMNGPLWASEVLPCGTCKFDVA